MALLDYNRDGGVGYDDLTETFTLPAGAPYWCKTSLVPKRQSGVVVTVGGVARTLVRWGVAPSAGQVSVDWFRGYFLFSSADSGGAASITYDGLGSSLDTTSIGTLAAQNSNAVAITGGTIVGLTNLEAASADFTGTTTAATFECLSFKAAVASSDIDLLRIEDASNALVMLVRGKSASGPYVTTLGTLNDGRLILDYNGMILEDVGFTIETGNLLVGDGTNGVTLSVAEGLKLEGTATVWDDLRVPAEQVNIIGPDNIPGPVLFRRNAAGTSIGTYALGFDKTVNEQIFFSAQLPHQYKPGSTIKVHVHWSTGNSTKTGNVDWRLEYTWANYGEVFPDTSDVLMRQAGTGVAYSHLITTSVDIVGTGKKESSMMKCRLYRDAVTDTFDDDALLLEVDFHYEVEKLGTPNELPA